MRKRFNPSTASSRISDSSLRFGFYEDDSMRDVLVSQLPAIIWTTDRELQITSCGGLSFIPYHRSPDEFIGMTLIDYFGAGNTAALYISECHQVLLGAHLEFDANHNGRSFTVRVRPLLDEESIVVGTVGVALEVTDRKASEEALKYLATHDPLTDLANYRQLLSSFDAELQRSDRTERPFTVLLLDVDGLKDINDRHGHLVGSKVLCRLAHVLKCTCRSIDTVARYGGDEFAILLVETDELAAHRVAQRIKEGLVRDTEEPKISASMGIAVYPRNGETLETLLAGADRMLYRNKLRLTLHKQIDSLQTETYNATHTPTTERRRSKRILQDLNVVVRGESKDRSFQEETFTISVNTHGALLMLESEVTLGQILRVRNPLTDREMRVRVASFGNPYGGIAQVGIEFQESATDFWTSDVQSNV